MNPERRRLPRGETVETCSPAPVHKDEPRVRGRPLGRCHTLDPGEETPDHAPQEIGPDLTQRDVDSDTHSSLEDGLAQPDSPPTPEPCDTPASPRLLDAHTVDEHAADLCPLEGAADVL